MKCETCQKELPMDATTCPDCGQGASSSPPPPSAAVPEPPPVRTAPSNGLAIASFILGLVSTVTMCWCGLLSIPLGVVGLILGLVAKKNPIQRGFSTAGIVLSLVGMVMSVIYIIVLVLLAIADQSGGY